MKKGKRKEEDDGETISEKREAKSTFGGIEAHREGLESHMTIDAARQERPVTAEAGSVALTDYQHNMVFQLVCLGESYERIMEVMGVNHGWIDRLEVERSVTQAELEIAEAEKTGEKGEIQDVDSNFEAYDPVKWATATEEENVDKARDEKDVPEPRLPHADKAVPETSSIPTSRSLQDPKDLLKESELKLQLLSLRPEFVRALKDSKLNSKPYFREGDILRVINSKTRRGKLGGHLYFDLLPLKPPGEAGKALIQDFEPADQAAADEVGREAKNDKEIDSFRCAMDWED